MDIVCVVRKLYFHSRSSCDESILQAGIRTPLAAFGLHTGCPSFQATPTPQSFPSPTRTLTVKGTSVFVRFPSVFSCHLYRRNTYSNPPRIENRIYLAAF
jgi:hypothetical protein